jgi:uncharacterized protein (UPF0335 family)
MSDVTTEEQQPEKKKRGRKAKTAETIEANDETNGDAAETTGSPGETTATPNEKPVGWQDVASASGQPTDQPTVRTYRGVVAVKLTDAELVAKGQQLLGAMAEVDRLEDEKSEEAKRYKGLIEDAEKARDAIRNVMRAKREDRELELREERCYRTHAIRLYRVDTGELLSEKPLTDEPLFAKAPNGELFDTATGEYSEPAPDSDPDGAIDDPEGLLKAEAAPKPESDPFAAGFDGADDDDAGEDE